MSRNHVALPHSVERLSSEERAPQLAPDWWRQIDRWVNEGGAEEGRRISAKFSSGNLGDLSGEREAV